jgi:hypothetical protein
MCGKALKAIPESTRINMILSEWVKSEVRDMHAISEESTAGHVSLKKRKNDDRYLSDI